MSHFLKAIHTLHANLDIFDAALRTTRAQREAQHEFLTSEIEEAERLLEQARGDKANKVQYWSPGYVRHMEKNDYVKRVQDDIAYYEAELRSLRAKLEGIEKEKQ
jgi:hypothetical protein